MVGDTELLGGFYVSKKYMSIFQKNNNPSKFRNSEKAATPKITQLLGLKTGRGITRTPYDGFAQKSHPRFSNCEELLAIIVPTFARMLISSESI